MQRRRRRKGLATLISTLILAVTAGVVVLLPILLAFIAHFIRSLLGYPTPMEFDMLLIGMFFLGLCLDVLIILSGLVYAIKFWLRYTAPFDGALCAKCGYNLAGTLAHSKQCPECGHWHESLTGQRIRPRAILICDDPDINDVTGV